MYTNVDIRAIQVGQFER